MQYTIQNDGFVILKRVFSENQLAPVRNLADEIVACCEKNFNDPFEKFLLPNRADTGVLYDLIQHYPEFRELAANDTILDELEKVLGHDIVLYENSLVYKPKGKNNAVPWHQDFINRRNEPIKYVAWIALDNIQRENGAMKVIPGSHKKGFLPWYRVRGAAYHDLVKREYVEEDKAIYTELEAGDVMLFHQLLLHSSDLVASDKPRRAFRVSYQNLENLSMPRGVPIVFRGCRPSSIAAKFGSNHNKTPSAFKEFLQTVGKKLIELSRN
ncbi:MAG TPA: phytanoyl-CoA dioxygenase family protein [Chitinophagales bacterium]|nr:phytanoyl-CoA dioxygenase family protein [Chitinophagales bacterium]